MSLLAAPLGPTTRRQVFAHWSIQMPTSLRSPQVPDPEYWHARDEHRSVSLTSMVITERGRPVSQKRILREIKRPMEGVPVALPPGLEGWGREVVVERSAVASRALTGIAAAKGRVLIVTVTSDDVVWATSVWLSIRHNAVPASSSHVLSD
jgi:hypothetical protein